MDPAKSQFPGDPPRDVVLKYEPDPKGFRFTSSGKLQNGTPYSYYFAGAADGKDYEVFQHNGFDRASARVVDGRLEMKFKRQGRVMVTHLSEFREGGKVMLNRSEYINANGGAPLVVTAHFDRQ